MKTESGIPVYYAASHANQTSLPFTFEAVFENATVRWTRVAGDDLTAYFKDGTTKVYGNPFGGGVTEKLMDCIDCVKNGTTPVCTALTALPHIQLIWDIYKTIPTVSFPEEAKAIQDHPKHGPAVVVPGLAENLKVAFERTCLLSEV